MRWAGNRFFRLVILYIGIAAVAFAALILILWLLPPNVKDLTTHNPQKTTMMRYREAQYFKKTGKRLWRNQTWVPLSRISPKLITAVVIAEDDKFFEHAGFDFEGMKEAFEKDIRTGRITGGGSTITQQLAKNLYLKPARNPVRKIREAVIAFKLNSRLKKSRILELYLNVIEWGRGIYGAEAASRTYYGKSCSDLTAEEAVRLASVLPNPIVFVPEDDRYYRMRKKRSIVAQLMVKRKQMTEEEFEALVSDLTSAGRW
jgi:monofunctional biosynthetic peptidoglycan transglycosylase